MLVRSKCQPQIMRHVLDAGDPDSPLLNYETRCPCGVQYCRITPEGRVTPCPYLPVVAGDLRHQSFGDVWRSSEIFSRIRAGEPGGKCGRCEYREVCGGCRARAYADAGASGFFVPRLSNPRQAEKVVKAVPLPLNLIAFPGAPPKRDWANAGVARISHGPFPHRALMATLEEMAREAIG